MSEEQFAEMMAVFAESVAELKRQTKHLEQIEERLYAQDKRVDAMRRNAIKAIR